MARRTKKKRRTTTLRSRLGGVVVSVIGRRRGVLAGAWLIGTAAMLWVVSISVPWLSRAVPRPQEPVDVLFVDAPQWIGTSLATHLTGIVRTHVTGSPMDQDELVTTRAALLDSGCFASIEQVQRLSTQLVEIHGTFLAPAAAVNDRDGDVLVTAEGMLLPSGYRIGNGYEPILIRNPLHDRPSRPASQWEGRDVPAALSLITIISGHPWAKQIESVDLSEYESLGTLVLETTAGCRLIWGALPGQERPLEAMAAMKLERLDHLHDRTGRIDQGRAGLLDLTGTRIVWRTDG